MADKYGTTSIVSDMQGLSSLAAVVLRGFLEKKEDGTRAERDRARIALSTINTAVSITRAQWTQQRHQLSIARTLADGDLDVFEEYIRNALPDFPGVRKAQLPTEKKT